MSTLFKTLGGGSGLPPIVEEFNSFRRGFSGNAKAEVEKLINSGQITQAQLNEAQAKASQLQQMLGQFGVGVR